MIRENLVNQPNAKITSEYTEVASNLYIGCCRIWNTIRKLRWVLDIGNDPDEGLKILEKVRQARSPDLYMIAANYSGDGESVIAAIRAGANDYLTLPLRRSDFRDAMTRLERTPRRAASGGSKLGKIYSFIGTKGGVGATTLAVNFASGPGAAQATDGADRSRRRRQQRLHAAGRATTIHVAGSRRESSPYGSGAVRRLSSPATP